RNLERRDGIECDSISGADHKIRSGTPRNSNTRSNCGGVVSFVPTIGLSEGNESRSNNSSVRNVHAACRFRRCGIDFPTHAVVDRQVVTEPPVVLKIEIVLLQSMSKIPQRDVLAGTKWQKCVGGKIA